MTAKSFAIDSSLAIALVFAVGATILADRFTNQAPDNPDQAGKPPQVVPVEPSQLLRLGVVTPPKFDDMGKLLAQLGPGYRDYTKLNIDALLEHDQIKDFDVIFLTCDYLPSHWCGESVGQGPRNSFQTSMKEDVRSRLERALGKFVEDGGTLYASDWQIGVVAHVFPKYVDPESIGEGAKQNVNADVVNEGLAEVIGKNISLNFDLPGWRPAAFQGREVTTYLRGRYEASDGRTREANLLVKFPFGKGNVIFTSFHNEKVNSDRELEILKYLVFASVTASAESKSSEVRIQGGFSPKKSNLLSVSKNVASVTKTYRATKAGRLQFVLAFNDQGAILALDVVGPKGEKFSNEGRSTFEVDIPNAATGEWTYTVTAKKVPFENFPYNLSVWQK